MGGAVHGLSSEEGRGGTGKKEAGRGIGNKRKVSDGPWIRRIKEGNEHADDDWLLTFALEAEWWIGMGVEGASGRDHPARADSAVPSTRCRSWQGTTQSGHGRGSCC